MIIAMAGLPGVGKSTLARALASRLDAVVLDKDQVRANLFPPSHVDYTLDQDDFCVDVMYHTSRWLLERQRATTVILDGCTYTRRYQVDTLREVVADLGTELRIIECACDDDVAVARLERDRAAGRHPAANRTPALYWEFQAAAETIPPPKLTVDTNRPVTEEVAECLAHLTSTPRVTATELGATAR